MVRTHPGRRRPRAGDPKWTGRSHRWSIAGRTPPSGRRSAWLRASSSTAGATSSSTPPALVDPADPLRALPGLHPPGPLRRLSRHAPHLRPGRHRRHARCARDGAGQRGALQPDLHRRGVDLPGDRWRGTHAEPGQLRALGQRTPDDLHHRRGPAADHPRGAAARTAARAAARRRVRRPPLRGHQRPQPAVRRPPHLARRALRRAAARQRGPRAACQRGTAGLHAERAGRALRRTQREDRVARGDGLHRPPPRRSGTRHTPRRERLRHHRAPPAPAVRTGRHHGRGWIRRQRLDRCRRDLRAAETAHLSITQIAYRWGFGDSSSFSKIFKREFASSPKDYRAAGGFSSQARRASSGWAT
ncbi:L-rhamnose operon regulatory protein RhaS [Methylibium sp. T29-B]|nr:L-rhamnose operon regulatory protein RhaS [Methylibium sp. T29-B]